MTLPAYQTLASDENRAIIGAKLPALKAGGLQIQSERLPYSALQAKVQPFLAGQAWVMSRGAVLRQTELPAEHDLLEAEYCLGEQSLHIRLEQPGLYRCTQLTAQTDGDLLYRDQLVHSREGGKQLLCYRLWWQLGTEAPDEGRYRPLAQQFLGFSTHSAAEGL